MNRFNQCRKCMYRSNNRIDVDICHALSGSFKSKKYVFIYPNNLMQTRTVWHISMLIIPINIIFVVKQNKKPLIFTDKWKNIN